MRIARFEISFIDTPGVALDIFFAGCTIKCPECQNKELQSFDAGDEYTVFAVTDVIKKRLDLIDWICFVGGEPTDQLDALILVAAYAKSQKLNTCLYTGRKKENLPEILLEYLDRIIDGEYNKDLKTDSFPASSNQRVWVKTENGAWDIANDKV